MPFAEKPTSAHTTAQTSSTSTAACNRGPPTPSTSKSVSPRAATPTVSEEHSSEGEEDDEDDEDESEGTKQPKRRRGKAKPRHVEPLPPGMTAAVMDSSNRQSRTEWKTYSPSQLTHMVSQLPEYLPLRCRAATAFVNKVVKHMVDSNVYDWTIPENVRAKYPKAKPLGDQRSVCISGSRLRPSHPNDLLLGNPHLVPQRTSTHQRHRNG